MLLLIVSIITNVYLWKKWKENEALFELSKSYEAPYVYKIIQSTDELPLNKWSRVVTEIPPKPNKVPVTKIKLPNLPIKYNKDGSIAKKRGRKPKV
jgi:hypothetical protein